MLVKINKLKCLRCGAVWTPRKADVRQCPKCRSLYWDTPSTHKKVTEPSHDDET